jgi:hypothetical protein
LAALLAVVVILTAGNRAPAADTIEELLQQDEASGQNELRPDLNALTEELSPNLGDGRGQAAAG